MTTRLGRLYVRTSQSAVVVAEQLLDGLGYTVSQHPADGAVSRDPAVWTDGDWVVIEDVVVRDMAVAAAEFGEAVAIECFGSDVTIVSRFRTDAPNATLIVGPGRPPGAGLVNSAALEEFASLVTDDGDLAQLRRLTRSTERPAEQVGEDIARLFGLRFLDDSDGPTIVHGVGGPDVSRPAEQLQRSSRRSGLRGVAGEPAGSVPLMVSFEKTGTPLDHARLELRGPALDDGLIEIDVVMYGLYDRPTPPRFLDTSGPVVDLDLRPFRAPDDPRVEEGRQHIGVGVEGTYLHAGAAELEFVLYDDVHGLEASQRVPVDVLDRAGLPQRRATFPDRILDRTATQRILLGDTRLVIGLEVIDRPATTLYEQAFTVWSGLLGTPDDIPRLVHGASGVRSLRPTLVGGNSQRWKRLRQALDGDGYVNAECEIDDTIYRFSRQPTLGRYRDGGWQVRLTVPNHAEASYQALAEIGRNAAAEHLIWQATIMRCGAPNRDAVGPGHDHIRVYNTAIGHDRFEPTSTRFLEEPGRLVLIEPELASRLDPKVVQELAHRSDIGNLVAIESNDWLPVPEFERLFDPILRTAPDRLEVPEGLSPAHNWIREP